MSDENVQVVRRLFDAVLERNWPAAIAEVDPNLEIDDQDIVLDTSLFRGEDKLIKWISIWDEAWDSWSVEELEIRSAGEDEVIALFLMKVKGKGSGVELDRRDAATYKLRDGKVVATGYYNDQRKALAAVGLAE